MMTREIRELTSASGADLSRRLDALATRLDQLTDAERLELIKASARLDAWTATVRARAIVAVFDSARTDIAQAAAELEASSPGRPPRTARVAGLSHDYDDERLTHRRVGTEVALVLGVSSWVADREVDLALHLRERPQLLSSLALGRLDIVQARTILAGVDLLRTGRDNTSTHRRATKLLTRLLGPDPSHGIQDSEDSASEDSASEDSTDLVRELRRPGVTLWSLVPGRLRQIIRREVARLDPAAAAEQARRALQ